MERVHDRADIRREGFDGIVIIGGRSGLPMTAEVERTTRRVGRRWASWADHCSESPP
jgi:hypothetical protein